MNWFTKKDDSVLLNIYLQPRASRDEVVGLYDNRLKVRVKAAPVEGKANQALVRYLAKLFAVAKRDVVLLSGESSRRKRLSIENVDKIPADVEVFL